VAPPVLLDVNVLVALPGPVHTQHEPAHRWFAAVGQRRWATCARTENAVSRSVGHPRYPNSPGSPAPVLAALTQMCHLPGHEFQPDDLSPRDLSRFDPDRLLDNARITDTYLSGLAVVHGGWLATFDRWLVADAVRGGRAAQELLQGQARDSGSCLPPLSLDRRRVAGAGCHRAAPLQRRARQSARSSGQRISHIQERKPAEVALVGVERGNTVLAQDGGQVGVGHEVAPRRHVARELLVHRPETLIELIHRIHHRVLVAQVDAGRHVLVCPAKDRRRPRRFAAGGLRSGEQVRDQPAQRLALARLQLLQVSQYGVADVQSRANDA
jgi:predicted nucleic acid-binding protein